MNVDWKPLPPLWTSPAVWTDLGELMLLAFMENGLRDDFVLGVSFAKLDACRGRNYSALSPVPIGETPRVIRRRSLRRRHNCLPVLPGLVAGFENCTGRFWFTRRNVMAPNRNKYWLSAPPLFT
jgi:hypothetical protein